MDNVPIARPHKTKKNASTQVPQTKWHFLGFIYSLPHMLALRKIFEAPVRH